MGETEIRDHTDHSTVSISEYFEKSLRPEETFYHSDFSENYKLKLL